MSVAPRGRRRGPDEDPIPVRHALDVVGAELGLPDAGALRALTDRWMDVVGPGIAPHARLRSVRGGVATIAVDAPLWATELRYLERALCKRVEEVTGHDLVRSVRVVVEPPA